MSCCSAAVCILEEKNQGMHGIRECPWITGLPVLCFRSGLDMEKPGRKERNWGR